LLRRSKSRSQLYYSEFYITNVCNFNCDNCNRFNNYSFAGNYQWKHYAEIYQQWAEVLDLNTWAIMGGEPMTNPDYIDWMLGVAGLWPDSTGEFVTNGHYLRSDNTDFYQAIKSTQGQVRLAISLHNNTRVETVLAMLQDWMQGPIQTSRGPADLNEIPEVAQIWQRNYNQIKDNAWPQCDTIDAWARLPTAIQRECEEVHGFSPAHLANASQYWQLVDSNNVTVLVKPENFFHQAAVRKTATRLTLHSSDPDKAHGVCNNKHCHHFIDGRLYKCGQVGLFAEFDRQFGLELDDQDRQLMMSYQPGQLDSNLEDFIAHIDDVIPQCKFCPDNFNNQEIFAAHGNKVKFIKTHAKQQSN
jgi:hypothetical protein